MSTQRWNFTAWARRMSTWLGLLTLAQGGAMVAYAQAPPAWQALLPDSLIVWLLGGMMVTGALTPIATSFKQRDLP